MSSALDGLFFNLGQWVKLKPLFGSPFSFQLNKTNEHYIKNFRMTK
jgi:hypothetical protein